MKVILFIIGFTYAAMSFSAELLQPNNNCDVQQKFENCVNNYCVSQSVISEEIDCEQICGQCAKEACAEYVTKTQVCSQISL